MRKKVCLMRCRDTDDLQIALLNKLKFIEKVQIESRLGDYFSIFHAGNDAVECFSRFARSYEHCFSREQTEYDFDLLPACYLIRTSFTVFSTRNRERIAKDG